MDQRNTVVFRTLCIGPNMVHAVYVPNSQPFLLNYLCRYENEETLRRMAELRQDPGYFIQVLSNMRSRLPNNMANP